jgi:hypothetical protein
MSKDLDRPLSLITSRSPGEGEAIKNIHENIQRLRNKIQVEVNQEYAKAANETGIVRMLQEHSNKFFSAFPAIQNSILFGQNGQ